MKFAQWLIKFLVRKFGNEVARYEGEVEDIDNHHIPDGHKAALIVFQLPDRMYRRLFPKLLRD